PFAISPPISLPTSLPSSNLLNSLHCPYFSLLPSSLDDNSVPLLLPRSPHQHTADTSHSCYGLWHDTDTTRPAAICSQHCHLPHPNVSLTGPWWVPAHCQCPGNGRWYPCNLPLWIRPSPGRGTAESAQHEHPTPHRPGNRNISDAGEHRRKV
ncbi:hypothetical protein GBAR_LOCUS23644, partial [Geodia barretti]